MISYHYNLPIGNKMGKMKTAWQILDEWGIDNPTEEQMWEAIAEADDYALDYYADGDLAEWL